MAFKVLVFAAVIAFARADFRAPQGDLIARTVYAAVKAAVPAEYDAHPQYTYTYDGTIASTGDSKGQTVIRDGDVIYIVDSDGTRSIAEPINVAVHKKAATPCLAVARTTYATPAVARVTYAAPAAKLAARKGYIAY